MAFERLLRAWSDERTLWRDARVCVVDKPAGVACEEAPGSRWGADLPARLSRHGLGHWAPAWSVPERASGVTVLVASDEGAVSAPLGELPFPMAGAVYIVAVEDWDLPSSGQFAAGTSGPQLTYRVARRNGPRALIEVRTREPPPVVLRAFAERGRPVIGDAGAPAATRLMLHVEALEGAPSARAPLPVEFDSWLSGAAVLAPAHFDEALQRAGLLRFGLRRQAEAFRLLSGDSGEIAGVNVDAYGAYAVLAISSEEAWRERERLARCLIDHGARGVYVKHHIRADLRGAEAEALAPRLPLRGTAAPEALCVRVGPVSHWVYLADGLSTGLFLDQRGNWLRLSGSAAGASVLNLFSYTGAFSVAAARGGASQTTSVDLSAKALGRLHLNLELNGLSGPGQRLLKADVPSWLARAGRSGRRYDRIVLDPPSFGTRTRGVLSTRRDYADLLRGAAQLLAPEGRLLCISHHRKISHAELCRSIEREFAAVGAHASLEPWVGDWDCPTLPGVSVTTSVLATRA